MKPFLAAAFSSAVTVSSSLLASFFHASQNAATLALISSEYCAVGGFSEVLPVLWLDCGAGIKLHEQGVMVLVDYSLELPRCW